MQQSALNQLMPKLVMSVLSVGWLVIASQPLMAQTTGAADLFDNSSDQNNGAYGNGGDLDMFDLMHRAQQGSIRNQTDFLRDQREQIGSEATNFRLEQQRALQQRQLNTVPSGSAQSGVAQPGTTQVTPNP